MSKVFQILNGRCHWQTPFQSLAETTGRFPPDCLFVEAPDYVNEQWGFDETEIGDDRFIKPVPPEGFIYDDETGMMYPEAMLGTLLVEAQTAKQNDNNNMLATYLDQHPLVWTDGKEYGVTLSDQNEIAMNLLSYEMALEVAKQQAEATGVSVEEILAANPPTLEWHARHEACVAWSYEDLVMLSMAIRQAVYPWYTVNQAYKTQIYACTTVKEVQAIQLVYAEPKTEESTETEGDTSTEETTPVEGITEETTTETTDETTSTESGTDTPTDDESGNA